MSEYYKKNRDAILQQKKNYRESNRDKLSERDKTYYEKNRSKILAVVSCPKCNKQLSKASLTRHIKKYCSVSKENN